MSESRSPVIIRCPLIPRRFCVNIFGTLWVRDKNIINPRLINHERIHTAQMRELLFIPFYIIYFLEWILRLMACSRWYDAYLAISFEGEAYSNDADPSYLSVRRPFAQWRSRHR